MPNAARRKRRTGEITLLTGQRHQLQDGQNVHVIDEGSGPALVFIHGLPGQALDFSPCMAELSQYHRCIAYDRIGYGASIPRRKNRKAGIEANVADLFDLLDALNVDQATLVGWSYGGHIAIAAAAERPDRIVSLILLGAAGPTFPWPRTWLDRILFRTPLGVPLIKLTRWLGARGFRASLDDAYGGPMPQPLVDAFVSALDGKGVIAHWLKEGAIWTPGTSPAAAVQQPCLILHGDADTRVPVSIAKDLHDKIPHSELIVLPGVGHWPFASHTRLVVDPCRTFLSATH